MKHEPDRGTIVSDRVAFFSSCFLWDFVIDLSKLLCEFLLREEDFFYTFISILFYLYLRFSKTMKIISKFITSSSDKFSSNIEKLKKNGDRTRFTYEKGIALYS